MVEISFKAPPLAPQIHLSFHHHSHRDNVTAPTGCPNFRSRLHFSHSRGGDTFSDCTCLSHPVCKAHAPHYVAICGLCFWTL